MTKSTTTITIIIKIIISMIMIMIIIIIIRQLEATGLPKSSALGLFGIPGLTAYLGLMEIGKPKVRSRHNIIDTLTEWRTKYVRENI